MAFNTELNAQFEELLDYFHEEKCSFEGDYNNALGERVVVVKKYDIRIYIVKEKTHISFDIYCELQGVYEIGDLHVLLGNMLRIKDKCKLLELRERNTTERLYPAERRGKFTETSGL